jgi:hypothetical protein
MHAEAFTPSTQKHFAAINVLLCGLVSLLNSQSYGIHNVYKSTEIGRECRAPGNLSSTALTPPSTPLTGIVCGKHFGNGTLLDKKNTG